MNNRYLKVIKHKFLEKHFEESLLFAAIGILSALACTTYAALFSLAEKTSIRIFSTHPEWMYVLSPLAMVIAFMVVRKFAPGASGSGIPQVLACIELKSNTLLRRSLRKAVIFIKILSSFIAVCAGAAIGREGPSLQIAAAIAFNTGRISEKLGIRVKVEQLLVAGAAGGLAAAFNTPIGGVVYAIEELSKEHVRNFRDVLILSVVLSGLTAQLISGNYLFLGYPAVTKDYSFWALGMVVILAIIAGFLGSMFSKILVRLIRWRSSLAVKKQILIVALIGLVFAVIFNYLGSNHLYSGKETINHVLFSGDQLPWYEALTRTGMPILSSMTGVAGGIFAPALSAGAAIGGVFASLVDPNLAILLGLSGMVGFLTGITHTPITSFILVLEMTDRHSIVFPMMLAALSSSFGAHLFANKSFYEEVVEDLKAADAATKPEP